MQQIDGENMFNSNMDKVKKYINQIIDKANSKYTTDCRSILNVPIKEILNTTDNKKYINNCSEIELMTIAYKTLFNVSYGLLTSGKLHIYKGLLNPLTPCNQLINICKMSWQFAVFKGEISEEQMNEQIEILYDNINAAG